MIVYVVSGHPEVCSALDRFADRCGSSVEIRPCRRVTLTPNNESIIVVLDLTSVRTRAIAQPALHRSCRYVVLVKPNQFLPLRWVEFVQRSAATLVKLRPGPRPLVDLIALLERFRDGISPDEIAQAVVEEWRTPDARSLVRLIFEHPWQVRRMADLERESGLRGDHLRAACHSAGFARVEHFLTAARGAGLNYLTAQRKLSVSRARTIVAISNPSNFRRQLRRARVQRAG